MSDELPPFEAFESIARLSRNCVISEKIDGTNAPRALSGEAGQGQDLAADADRNAVAACRSR
jgi:hypothetical protein